MAARSDSGFIYFVQGQGGGSIKVGWATDVESRMNNLQTGCPVPLLLHGKARGTLVDERSIHDSLRPWRTHGEWYRPSVEVIQIIRTRFQRPRMLPSIITHGSEELLHVCSACASLFFAPPLATNLPWLLPAIAGFLSRLVSDPTVSAAAFQKYMEMTKASGCISGVDPGSDEDENVNVSAG